MSSSPAYLKNVSSNYCSVSAQVDASRVNAGVSDILDYASSSDSDVEPTIVSDTVRGPFLDDSDTESVHSPQEDPLKYVASFSPLTKEITKYFTHELHN